VQDVARYLDLLLPDLRGTLLDAIPDVRRTSARAIGALAVALGEDGLPGIVAWLMTALVSGGSGGLSGSLPPAHCAVVVSSSAERSGAAMGLAEVCAALSDSRIEDILNRVLGAGKSSPQAREGGLMLLAAMPFALGDRYEDRLAMALASILRGLSDDSDSVREAALDAGRKTVTAYAKTSLETLLPELLAAMRDKRWRIRQAATQLLGDFLLVIAGAIRAGTKADVDAAGNDAELINSDDDGEGSDGGGGDKDGQEGGESTDEDDVIDSPEMMQAAMTLEATMKAIEEVLGIGRRNEVLAALYIVRCDVSIRVRQMGMQVWKTVVSNTPRVLREIMPCAVRQVVVALSDEDEERRAAAGKALGDLSHKLGDRVVPEVLPALQAGITDTTVPDRVRLGACDGLSELVSACPKDQLVAHAAALLAAVCHALCDRTRAVRESGAQVFATLLRPLGSTAVDAVIPMLIGKLSCGDDEVAELALDGMKQIMAASGTRLLSIVVPQLVAERPLTVESCRALTAAATAAEGEFEVYVMDVVDLLIEAVDSDSAGALPVAETAEPIAELLAAMAGGGDEIAVQMLEKVYLAFNEVSVSRRLAAGTLCSAFCRRTDRDTIAARAVSLFEVLIRQLSDRDPAVVLAAWQALMDLTRAVPASSLTPHVGHIRQALRSTAAGVRVGDPTAVIAGLNVPKGPAPFVPIFTEALLHGSPSAREQAALSIGDLTEMTDANVLAPFVIKLTGPLIRVASERFPWQVKAAILRAMLQLLEKAAPLLRTFAPQLQSTFVKSLADPNRLVRVRGCAALGALVPVQPRVEALLNELLALGDEGPHAGARAAAYLGAARVLKCAKQLPAAAFSSVPSSLLAGLQDEDAGVGKAAARALGVLASRSSGAEGYRQLVAVVLARLEADDADYDERARLLQAVGYMSRAGVVVGVAGGSALEWRHVEDTAAAIARCLRSSVPPLQTAAAAATVDMLVLLEAAALKAASSESRRELLAQLSVMAEADGSAEVRVGVLQAVKKLVAKRPDVVASLAPALVTCAGANNTAIRNAADRVLRRAFVVAGLGTVDSKNVAAAKSELEPEDRQFIDRRLLNLVEMPDSDVEDDLAVADD
jgi:HEAT repeat